MRTQCLLFTIWTGNVHTESVNAIDSHRSVASYAQREMKLKVDAIVTPPSSRVHRT